jgi:hypothetical protein
MIHMLCMYVCMYVYIYIYIYGSDFFINGTIVDYYFLDKNNINSLI